MSEFQYKAGVNHVGSYQVSGIPYATSSLIIPSGSAEPMTIVFPSVTQHIHITNYNNSYGVRVGFSRNGVKDGQHVLLQKQDAAGKNIYSIEMRVKVDRIYLLSDDNSNNVSNVNVYAELTGIKPDFNLAAAYSGSAGIG